MLNETFSVIFKHRELVVNSVNCILQFYRKNCCKCLSDRKYFKHKITRKIVTNPEKSKKKNIAKDLKNNREKLGKKLSRQIVKIKKKKENNREKLLKKYCENGKNNRENGKKFSRRPKDR